MNRFRFIFLRLCLYLIAGILATLYFRPSLELVTTFFITSLLIYLFAFIRSRNEIFTGSLPGLASFFLIFCLGMSTTFFSIPENHPEHYLHKNLDSETDFLAEGVITEELKPGINSARFILKVRKLISKDSIVKTSGKVLLNLKEDSISKTNIQPGKSIMFPWHPKPIKPAVNPFQFDFSRYMSRQKVQSQINLNNSQLKALKADERIIRAQAWQLREELIKKLKEKEFGRQELSVLQALILGQKRDLDDELYKKYAAAGAIHILAISGLHIGILLLILNFLFKPFENLRRGKALKVIIIILLLWSFAFLTGLSPSVVRAVTMFSFLSVGMQMNRKTSSLNALFLSLFFLLIIDPYMIFQVGFQLSYLAVLSIILFQPIIYHIFVPKIRILDYFWKLISVSLAAQIGVIPLSLFYFHQFPGLFLLSNLIVLPGLGILLTTGLLVFILAYLNFLPDMLARLLEYLIAGMNSIIEQIAGVESMVFSNIQFTITETLLAYLIIFGVFMLSIRSSFNNLLIILCGILVFQASVIYQKTTMPSEELVVFNSYRRSLIIHKSNSKATIMSDSISEEIIPKDYLRERMVSKLQRKSVPRIIPFKDISILVVDTLLNHKISSYKPEILLLRKNAKLNLDRLLNELRPEIIIADGSNTPYYLKKWKATALKKKIPLHHTGEKGAYILNSENAIICLKKYP